MKALFLTLAICINFSCSNDDNYSIFQPINPILIGKGNLYGNNLENLSQQRIVITSLYNWNRLLTNLNAVNNVTDSFTETDIDFNKFQIIAVFDEVKQYGGYSIDITSIAETETSIIVTVQHLLKGGGNAVITQPYHIVKILKLSKPIAFR